MAENRGTVLMAQALTPLFAGPTLAALALAAVHLAWLAPELRPARPPPVEAGNGTRLRLFSANLLYVNPDMEGIAAELRALRPDVVALQEVSPLNLAALEAAGAFAEYPHRLLEPRADAFGTAILSRLPLVDSESVLVAGLPLPRTTVVVGDRRMRLYDLHTRAPMGREISTWKAQLAGLRRLVMAERGPRVVAGDLNATSGHRAFRDLLGRDLRDAHVERGRWWVTTWPSDRRWYPPLARLDHVLVSPEVAVLDVREGTGRGSDHRPVVADLALLS
ncbi:MAG TPA: endonuclease/exonuclease/phosphatase family protein [Acidimicrobiales bacterium]|nr:endonuclease/exonuclease/phosphatase family protein [Acidimicrobiales bacterium]